MTSMFIDNFVNDYSHDRISNYKRALNISWYIRLFPSNEELVMLAYVSFDVVVLIELGMMV